MPATVIDVRRLALVFAFGTIGGGTLDQIHVQSQTTVYENPILLGQPWYIALVFGTGIALGWVVAQPFARKLYPEPPPLKTIALHAVTFLGAYFASAALHSTRPLAAAVLWSTFFARAVASPNPRALLGFAGIAAIGGTAIEIAVSALGSFHYVGSDFLGVPLWLPALYAHAAPIGLALARRFPIQSTDGGAHAHDRGLAL